MANLGMNFDASQVAPSESFDALPAGNYLVQIVKSEMKPTKNGDGQFLWLEHEIIDGEFTGRKLWNNLNMINQSAEAVQIAQRQLSAICHAIGEMNVSDSEQLHFKPLVAVVKTKPVGFREKNGYTHTTATNEIGGYKPAEGATPATQARPATQGMQHSQQTYTGTAQQAAKHTAPTAAPPAAKTAPWQRARTAA